MKSLIAAFATFSRIPLPMVEFSSDDFKYSMCYFPLVGAFIGALEILTYYICSFVGATIFFRAAIMAVLPILITGGIHMDGYCDTSDAFNCYQDREKKLEILKDPHIGAFGVIRMFVWFIVYYGLMASDLNVIMLSLSFVISRAITAYTVVSFDSAKKKGMGASEQSMSEKPAVIKASIFWLIISLGLGEASFFLTKSIADLFICPVMILVAVFLCMRYKKRIYRELGGFTGDTSGWYLTLSELFMALVVVIFSWLA